MTLTVNTGRARRFGKWPVWLLYLLPLGFLVLFFFYPLLSIFSVSLFPEGILDLSGFARITTSSYYTETFKFTLWQAVLSTVLTIGLALPTAYIFTRYQFPGKSFLLSFATLPFVLPTVVVAAAFEALLGRSGIVNNLLMSLFRLEAAPVQLERTLVLILIAHVFYNYAVALRILVGYWTNQNPRFEEAARVLGMQGWRLWWSVRLPLLRPALLAASALVFIFTFTSFGVIVILGGLEFATLEVEIYRQSRDLFNLPMAAALSLVQIVTMFALMFVYTRLQRSIVVDLQSASRVAREPRTFGERLAIAVTLIFMALLLFSPLIALVIRSLTAGAGVGNYTGLSRNLRGSVLFVPPAEAIGNSLTFALVTTLLAVSLGVITAYLLNSRSRIARWLDPVFMLPLATSAVTLGFGFIIALDEPPLNLRSSVAIIPLAHTLVAMPFVVRSVLPALRSIPPNLGEAARSLGASPLTVWRLVDLPLVSRAVAVGATFAFTVSMGEFGASLFVARPDTPTMPVVIFRLLGQPGSANYGQALAMSVILMAVCAFSFVILDRLRGVGVGEF
jgi:thiamine transport system permease protein